MPCWIANGGARSWSSSAGWRPKISMPTGAKRSGFRMRPGRERRRRQRPTIRDWYHGETSRLLPGACEQEQVSIRILDDESLGAPGLLPQRLMEYDTCRL